MVATAADRAAAVVSQLKRAARAAYSNPPAHGAALLTTILVNALVLARRLQPVEELLHTMEAVDLSSPGVRASALAAASLALAAGAGRALARPAPLAQS